MTFASAAGLAFAAISKNPAFMTVAAAMTAWSAYNDVKSATAKQAASVARARVPLIQGIPANGGQVALVEQAGPLGMTRVGQGGVQTDATVLVDINVNQDGKVTAVRKEASGSGIRLGSDRGVRFPQFGRSIR
jgi:hypothetical protein